jgi:hypothetical protein
VKLYKVAALMCGRIVARRAVFVSHYIGSLHHSSAIQISSELEAVIRQGRKHFMGASTCEWWSQGTDSLQRLQGPIERCRYPEEGLRMS